MKVKLFFDMSPTITIPLTHVHLLWSNKMVENLLKIVE